MKKWCTRRDELPAGPFQIVADQPGCGLRPENCAVDAELVIAGQAPFLTAIIFMETASVHVYFSDGFLRGMFAHALCEFQTFDPRFCPSIEEDGGGVRTFPERHVAAAADQDERFLFCQLPEETEGIAARFVPGVLHGDGIQQAVRRHFV